MAEIYVTNSLNLNKSVKFNIGLRYFVIKDDNTDGDHKWVLEIGTTHSGSDGTTPLSKKTYSISDEDFDEVVEGALSDLCSRINWSPFINDNEPPYLISVSPAGNDTPIGSVIYVGVKEDLPSSGIDLSDISVTINNGTVDFDITNEISVDGDPYEYNIKWVPPNR